MANVVIEYQYIQLAQHLDLIYLQFGMLYGFLHNAPITSNASTTQ